MFTHQANVNILTALLAEHGVCHAVVCPGSRNAPIVHNLNEYPDICCHPVTDERSAGFYALGIAQATQRAVAVCVTSGTALLNLAPAVAEAFHQHVPLVVISADRPQAWIGQLDGQTMPQQEALCPFVRKTVMMPGRIDTDEDHWHANRLVNEALLVAVGQEAPVQINVPLSEPLFVFDVPQLKEERVVRWMDDRAPHENVVCRLASMIAQARRPMMVLGQCAAASGCMNAPGDVWRRIGQRTVVLREALCRMADGPVPFDEVLAAMADDDTLLPDFIVYLGDTLVSKRLRHFLRKASDATVVMVSSDGELHDPTMHANWVMRAEPADVVPRLSHAFDSVEATSETSAAAGYVRRWNDLLNKVYAVAEGYEPPFSQMAVVRYLEQQVDDMEVGCAVHYANSSPVRLANIYARHPVWCNRGVNGIEGSLSTAAGFSVATDDLVICVIGDLSFFYDQNALWNSNLRGNLRIILLNNGRGGIFAQLPGLGQSPAYDKLVSGAHHTSAQGICTQNDVGYLKATDLRSMKMGVVSLLTTHHTRPVLLEVFTDATADGKAIRDYYNTVITNITS